MTFLELCQRLRLEVGAAGTGPAAVSGQNGEYLRLISWIQQAWLEIQMSRKNWRFLWRQGEITLDPDFLDYSLPRDVDSWDADTLKINDTAIKFLPWPEFKKQRQQSAENRRPFFCTITPDRLVILDSHPEPNSSLSFEYFQKPQRLIESGDAPVMPEQYHMLIVYRAMMSYALYENASEVAQRAQYAEGKLMPQLLQSEIPTIQLGESLA